MSTHSPHTVYVPEIRRLATRIFEQETNGNPTWTVAELPDCFDCCELFIEALSDREQTRVTVPDALHQHDLEASIRTVSLPDEYTHYVVEVTLPCGCSFIVDASFGQFAVEVETPITVAPAAEIDHVVVVEKSTYVFAQYITAHRR